MRERGRSRLATLAALLALPSLAGAQPLIDWIAQSLPDGAQEPGFVDQLPSYRESFVRTLTALALLVATLWILARLLPRWLRARSLTGGEGLIEIVETRRLEHRKALYLARVGGEYLLIGSSEGRLELLSGKPLDSGALDRLRSQLRGAEQVRERHGPSA